MTRTTARWSAFGAFAALCCVLGCENQPKYAIETQILVVRKSPEGVFTKEADTRLQEDYMATQGVLIKSPTIIIRALKKPNLKGLKVLEGENPWVAVRDALEVRRDPDGQSAILYITLHTADEKEGVAVVEAIIKSYQEFLDETYKNISDKTLDLIIFAKQALQEKLNRAEQEYQEFRLKNPFLFVRGSEGFNAPIARLRVLDAKRTELEAKRAELDGRLTWIESAGRDKKNAVAVLLKANEWAARSGFDKLSIEARQGKDALTAFADSLKQEIEENRAIQKAIDDRYEVALKEARDIANYEAVDDRLRRSISSTQNLFDSIVKRVNELGLTRDFGGYDAQVISPPRAKKAK